MQLVPPVFYHYSTSSMPTIRLNGMQQGFNHYGAVCPLLYADGVAIAWQKGGTLYQIGTDLPFHGMGPSSGGDVLCLYHEKSVPIAYIDPYDGKLYEITTRSLFAGTAPSPDGTLTVRYQNGQLEHGTVLNPVSQQPAHGAIQGSDGRFVLCLHGQVLAKEGRDGRLYQADGTLFYGQAPSFDGTLMMYYRNGDKNSFIVLDPETRQPAQGEIQDSSGRAVLCHQGQLIAHTKPDGKLYTPKGRLFSGLMLNAEGTRTTPYFKGERLSSLAAFIHLVTQRANARDSDAIAIKLNVLPYLDTREVVWPPCYLDDNSGLLCVKPLSFAPSPNQDQGYYGQHDVRGRKAWFQTTRFCEVYGREMTESVYL